jgi:hypothetical protein
MGDGEGKEFLGVDALCFNDWINFESKFLQSIASSIENNSWSD